MVKSEENIVNNDEKHLKSSEFRTFFENILDAVLLTIPDGTILAANPAAEELFGYTEEEICKIGRNGLVDKDDPNLPILVKERIRTGKAKGEITFIRKDGTKFPGEMSTSIFKDDNGDKRTSMVIRDITTRKQADKALMNSEERYRSIIENLQDAYIRADKEGNIIMASPSAADMYKFDSSQELIGISSLTLYKKPEDRKNLMEQLLKHGKVEDYESEAIRKDGSSFLVSLNSQFHYDEQDQIQGTEAFVRDITERKQAENQIEYQANLLSRVNDAVIGFTPNLQITYWNKGAEQMYGYSADEALSKTTTEILRPTYNTGDQQKLIKEIKNLGLNRTSAHLKHKNGAEVIAEIDSTQIINASGNIEYIAVYRDITQQKNLEEKRQELLEQVQLFNEELEVSNEELKSTTEELHQQKNKISEILESIQDNFYVIDHNWNYIYINKQSANAVNMKPQDFIGQNHWQMFPQYVGTVMEENFIAAMEKREVRQFEMYSPYNNNWFLVTVYPSMEGITIMGTNITERKKAEEDLQNANDRFDHVLNKLTDFFAIADPKWRYLYVNDAYTQFVGKNRKQLIGHVVWDIIPGAKGTLNYENCIKTAEDKITRTWNSYSPFTDHWMEYRTFAWDEGVATLARDITKRKLLEEKVQKRTEELSKSNIELKRSNKELEQFAYVSSHDLQEPIRMVTSFTQLLERRYKGQLDNEADDYIEFIVEGAYRMKYLIDDLLTYSRVSSQNKEFENVDLEKVLENVISNLSLSIKDNNARITHEPLPNIKADTSQMMQVFQNLIANAIKFHGSQPPEIHITTLKDNNKWTFAVKDNGIGIEEEYQKQIFEVFKRLHTRAEYPGSGIGLSVSQKIIRHHRGNIWVESELGKGSTFYFTIPLKID